MNYYHIISKQPKCKTCGKPLKEWNPFMDVNEHEHIECASKRISDSILEGIKGDLKKMDDQYCTFCNKYINKNELTFTEDAEPAHVKCLNNFQQHWNDRDEAFDLLGF